MSKDLTLTKSNDKLTITDDGDYQWFTVFAQEGDDEIILQKSNVSVNPGQGNDRIVNETNQPWPTVVYWDSPNGIQADLQTGVVQDGWGTTDTLVNIHNLHTSGRNGDVILGSSTEDYIWLNGFWQKGTSLIDGRGGNDTVTSNAPLSSYELQVSADAKEIRLTKNGYTATLLNIEAINLWDGQAGITTHYQAVDLIDQSKVGPAVLLTSGQKGWANQVGQPVSLSYSFMSGLPSYGGGQGGTGFEPPTESYKQAVRAILQELQTQTGLQFTEVADNGDSYGQLRFGTNQQSATKGYSYTPGSSITDERLGDVWMDKDTLSSIAPGQEGWQALLHEIAHALGLSHPRQAGDGTTGPVLIDAWNNNAYTVMSSANASPDLWQSWYAPYDMQALQYLYGVGSGTLPVQDNFYQLRNADGKFLQTLTDAGGNDTLDASALSLGAILDLRPGHFMSAGIDSSGAASWNNIFTGYNTLIERLYDTPHDDVIWGNTLDNTIHWSGGNDVIDGQAGIDTLVIDGPRSQFDLGYSDYTNQFQLSDLQGQLGSVSLNSIEKIIFRDSAVTLGATSANAISESTTSTPPALFFDRTVPFLQSIGTATSNNRILPEAQLTLLLNEAIQPGNGQIKLTNVGKGTTETFSGTSKNLIIQGNKLSLSGERPLQINTTYKIEFDSTAITDMAGNPLTTTPAQTFRVGNPDGLYQFFVVAFGAAPGGVYMDQLSEAYNYGLSIKTIVNIFTTKTQFTDTYATSLTHAQLANKLVNNIVKTSASAQDKTNAIKDITDALDYGMTVGDVIYTVFGNLANQSISDPHWGGTALQFQKQTSVAKYLTEVMDYRTSELPILQSVLSGITPQTDVSTSDNIVNLIGIALYGSGHT
ncbi:Ig-like domain-containing protein [Limnohabitans radicicola]|uniref:Ig-like domain-containing protein n=1 Tax=Limnohabitans radicicola TaxID=2771427 RepID=A0A927FE28_9BURK|nr:Ig-like domain-containing protein [Limnohabitans radicicola]MBD8049695.1 Ig-like domain-containing protein [Limnohabitans radicicola]